MSSLQRRIASVTSITANLIAELSELDRLRDQVREAQLAAQSSRRYIEGKRPRVPGGVELERDWVNPPTPARASRSSSD